MKNKKILKLIIKLLVLIPAVYYLFMFVSPIFMHILNIGNILGILVCLAVIFAVIFIEKIVAFCQKWWKIKKGKICISIVSTVLVIGIACFSVTLGSVIKQSTGDAENQKTIIVLGCSVRGTTPSFTLKSRVKSAYNYLNENPDSVAVLSGGQGRGESISEAQCMYELLTEKGIDESRLYIEDKSTSTSTNIICSKKVIEENNLSNDIAVVSSDYHLKRAKLICKKQGLDVKTISSPSTYFDKPTFFMREVLGTIKEFIF